MPETLPLAVGNLRWKNMEKDAASGAGVSDWRRRAVCSRLAEERDGLGPKDALSAGPPLLLLPPLAPSLWISAD